MGASSSSMVGARGYSLRAHANKKFADSILTMMFKQTDFQDLLTLTNLSACPKYVFTTATALSALFTNMKVAPIKGKSQEILFAPLSYLAPTEASVKGVGVDTGRVLAARMAERNELCMEIAYFYIRIFQIYAALALTVMDADPVRVRRLGDSAGAAPIARGAIAKPSAAPFAQRGGSATSQFSKFPQELKQEFLKSNFGYFDAILDPIKDREKTQLLIKTDDPKRYVYFTLTQDGLRLNEFDAFYVMNDRVISSFKIQAITDEISAILQSPEFGSLLRVRKDKPNEIIPFDNETGILIRNPRVYILDRFKSIFEESMNTSSLPTIQPSYSGPGPSIYQAAARFAGPQIQIAPGKSVFEGFEQLKKIYSAKTTSPTFVFPKAYCIARAMTLMNPIFKEELSKPTQMPIVQVCSPKLDFEVGGDDYMPRARNVASANLYFKSFIALFYDSFTIGGGTIEFTQTEDGKSKLLEASKLLAQLYRVKPEDQPKFLLGSIQFPQLNLCVSTDSTKASPTTLYIKDPKFRQEFFTKNIIPMLQHQEKHTAKVNSLLKKLFTMKGEKLLLNPTLLAGGRVELNAIGYEAHQLLLDYYLKSEAWYIKGCIELNNNKGKLQT